MAVNHGGGTLIQGRFLPSPSDSRVRILEPYARRRSRCLCVGAQALLRMEKQTSKDSAVRRTGTTPGAYLSMVGRAFRLASFLARGWASRDLLHHLQKRIEMSLQFDDFGSRVLGLEEMARPVSSLYSCGPGKGARDECRLLLSDGGVDEDEDENDEGFGGLGEDGSDCGLMRDGTCDRAGSEECDECPFQPNEWGDS